MNYKKIKLLCIVIFFSCFSSCSIVEKNQYYKISDSNKSNWMVVRNKKYTVWNGDYTHQYTFCSGKDFSLTFNFTQYPKNILIGPPLIPFLPIKAYDRSQSGDFSIEMILKTNKTIQPDSILKYIHFFFNDTLTPKLPSDFFVRKDEINTKRIKDEFVEVCNKNVTGTGTFTDYTFIALKFPVAPLSIKNVSISFDNEYIYRDYDLHLSTLHLNKKNRLRYSPLQLISN